MFIDQAQQDTSTAAREILTISGLKVLLSTSAVIWVWALCWWLPFWFVILYVTPFLLIVSWLINSLVEWRFGRWTYSIPARGYDFFRWALVMLVMAAPLSSYGYGQRIAQQLVQELSVDVRLVEQRVSVLEQFGFGERRSVISIYELLEPQEVVGEKIRQRIVAQGAPPDGNNPIAALGWQFGNQELHLLCESENRMYTSIRINQIGQLLVHLLYYSSPYCRLK